MAAWRDSGDGIRSVAGIRLPGAWRVPFGQPAWLAAFRDRLYGRLSGLIRSGTSRPSGTRRSREADREILRHVDHS